VLFAGIDSGTETSDDGVLTSLVVATVSGAGAWVLLTGLSRFVATGVSGVLIFNTLKIPAKARTATKLA
jgi:S-adenosylmethionine/arginine decarboxylase-like enzyme